MGRGREEEEGVADDDVMFGRKRRLHRRHRKVMSEMAANTSCSASISETMLWRFFARHCVLESAAQLRSVIMGFVPKRE